MRFARPLYAIALLAVLLALPRASAADRDPEEIVKNPDHPAVKISGDEPKYPEDAKRMRVAGIVILDTVIERDGHVSSAIVLKPLPFGLDQAALDAVYTWKFEPATDGGQVVRSDKKIAISFRPPQ